MPLQASLKPFGCRIVFVVQGFADGSQGFRPVAGQANSHEVRMLRSLVRLAGPESDVIQGQMLVDGIAIHHGAQAPVADGKGLLEEGGRAVVMQDQVALRGACAGRREQQKRKETFHHSTGLLSIGQPVRVETTGMRE